RSLQLNRDFFGRLGDVVVFAVGLISARNYLYPQLAVRDARRASLAVTISFELHSAALLMAMLVDRMQDHAGVFDGLAIRVFDDNEVDLTILLVASRSEESEREEGAEKDDGPAHNSAEDTTILRADLQLVSSFQRGRNKNGTALRATVPRWKSWLLCRLVSDLQII